MKNVVFVLKKIDESIIELEYQPFDNLHSSLWYNLVEEYANSNLPLVDTDRVYNFNQYAVKDFNKTIISSIEECNKTIEELNRLYSNTNIPLVNRDTLQGDVNYIHRFFVETDRSHLNLTNNEKEMWSSLNSQLHGLEILLRSKGKKFKGSIFVQLPTSTVVDIPNESYRYFTNESTFGICYSNYPHVGRHIKDVFLANDYNATTTDLVPQNKISGSSFLRFGNDSFWLFSKFEMFLIKKWFIRNNIEKKLNMSWGDPKLAIGRLPVAKLVSNISKQDLYGIIKIVSVFVR